jgi:hypothetical protein
MEQHLQSFDFGERLAHETAHADWIAAERHRQVAAH